MNDVAEQIRAWADAAAPESAAPTVRANEGASMPTRSARRPSPRLLAVAAVVLFVAALAGVVVATNRDDSQSVTAGPTEDTGGAETAGPVAFEVLAVSESYLNDLGVLRAASSATELRGLWEVSGAPDAAPTIDFDRQVVVSITIPDDTCPPTLEAFDREGPTLSPRFAETGGRCDDLLVIPRTFVVALDRSTTGEAFRLVLAGQPEYEFGDTFLHVGGAERPFEGVAATFHLSGDTVAAGSTIAGTVQVNNQTTDALERPTCGAYFVAVLRGDAATQIHSRPRCIGEPFVVPPGSSSYPVTAKASYLTCINGKASELVPVCLPDGSMPSLPPGIYAATIDQPAGDPIVVSGPITVTVT